MSVRVAMGKQVASHGLAAAAGFARHSGMAGFPWRRHIVDMEGRLAWHCIIEQKACDLIGWEM